MLKRNLRDLRARGLSGFQPWDHTSFYDIEKAVKSGPHPDRFRNLKAPGPVADRIRASSYFLSDPFSTFRANPTGAALEYGYRELLGWIAGKPGDFTEQSCRFRPGEKVEKSLMILNDSRLDQTVVCRWKTDSMKQWSASTVRIKPGGRAEVPIRFTAPEADTERSGRINAEFKFANGEILRDTFPFAVLPARRAHLSSRIGLWDPEKSAAPLLEKLGVKFRLLRGEGGAGAGESGYDRDRTVWTGESAVRSFRSSEERSAASDPGTDA